jgi:ketosteroid isomerase-like protein
MSHSRGGAATIRAFFDAFDAGDLKRGLALLSPDVVWIYHGPTDRIPFAGVFRGIEGVEQFFARVAETIEVKEMAVASLHDAGDFIVGRGVEHSRSLATGKEYRVNWLHVYRVENGLVTSFEEFLDTAAVAEALA